VPGSPSAGCSLHGSGAGPDSVNKSHLDLKPSVPKNAGHLDARVLEGRRRPTRSTLPLELVSETVDQAVDVEAVYTLVVAMLVRHARRQDTVRADHP